MNRSFYPLFLTCNVTTDCNLRCKYCFMQPLKQEYMEFNDFKKIVLETSKIPIFLLNISGGEPFKHPEINKILKIAHKYHQHVMVLSNGTLIQNSNLDTISEIIDDKKRFPIQISLDSIDSEINIKTRSKSTKTIENIKKLSEIGAQVVVSSVITKFNFKEIINTIDYLSQYTKFFHIMQVQDIRKVIGIEHAYKARDQEEKALWEELKRIENEKQLVINSPISLRGEKGCATGSPCMAAFSHLVIDPKLEIRPCDRLTDVVVGNLKEQSIKDIWDSESTLSIIKSPIPYCQIK